MYVMPAIVTVTQLRICDPKNPDAKFNLMCPLCYHKVFGYPSNKKLPICWCGTEMQQMIVLGWSEF
jgi:hypothetical protein